MSENENGADFNDKDSLKKLGSDIEDKKIYTENEMEKAKLEEEFFLAPSTELARVIADNAKLRLEILQSKKANLRIWSFVGIMAIFMAILIYSWVAVFPKYKYIVTTNNQAICQAGIKDNPLLTPATITAFALDAVINSYTYDYVNYRAELNRSADTYFTSSGRKSFFESLDQSQNLKRVIDGRYILKAYPINSPQLQEEGVTGIKKYWVVHVPIAIEFYSGHFDKPQSRQTFIAEVTIVQEPTSALNLKGIAVDNLVLRTITTNIK